MPIVVDANLFVVLVSGDPRSDLVERQLQAWNTDSIELHAPDLALYEIANALTRLINARQFSRNQVAAAWTLLRDLPITYHRLIDLDRVVEIALTLNRSSAYDAAYLALAESLNAELWTLDTPLYRNAITQGFAVRLLS